jgi:CDP-diacylglycerol---glycerol-3-phosphate 3-phosphatidyltransferase
MDKKIKKSEKIKKEIVNEIEKEIFLNVPNSLTLLRLILTFVFIYMLFMDYSKIVLVIVFAIAALTDFFDGFFARKLNQKTKIGARLDQFADRIFTIAVVIAIFVYAGSNLHIQSFSRNNLIFLFLICSREIISIPAVLIVLFRRKDWYKVRQIGRVTTFVQALALGAVIINFPWTIYIAIPTCILGIIAAFDYLRYALS